MIQYNGVISADAVKLLMEQFTTTIQPQRNMMYRYYLNTNPVPNEKNMENPTRDAEAYYITKTAVNYFIGNPVIYETIESQQAELDTILDLYHKQNKSSLDNLLATDTSIYGVGYELVYKDEASETKSAKLDPKQTFVVYDYKIVPEPVFGFYYQTKGSYKEVTVYDNENRYIFKEVKKGKTTSYTMTEMEQHFFKELPIIEAKNNSEQYGDFQRVVSLIDALNMVESNSIEDIQKHINSLLKLIGYTLGDTPEEQLENAMLVKKAGVIEIPDGGDAGFISNTLTQADVQVLKDNLMRKIHMYSFVPNLTDDSFANNVSGVAMKYKLLGLDNLMLEKSRFFDVNLKKRLELYDSMIINGETLGGGLDLTEVKITYTRNLPNNDVETATMVATLSPTGTVSKETLSGQLSFVDDPEAEVEQASKETVGNTDFINDTVIVE